MNAHILGKEHAINEGIIIGLEKHLHMTNEISEEKRNMLYSFLFENSISLTSDINTLDFICKEDDNKIENPKPTKPIIGFNDEYLNKLKSLASSLSNQEEIYLNEKREERLNHISDTYKKSGSSFLNFFAGTELRAKNNEIEWADKYFDSKKKHIEEGIFLGLSKHTKIVSYLSKEKTKKLLDLLCENNLVLTIDDNRNFHIRQNDILSKKLTVFFHEDLNEKELIMNEVFYNRINSNVKIC